MAAITDRPESSAESLRVLICWSRHEENSWTPDLAEYLRRGGDAVTEVHDLESLRELPLGSFDVCLPRFRMGDTDMACLDEVLMRSRIPMLNSYGCRRLCENKALAHLAFEETGLRQPQSFVISREGVIDRHLEWPGSTIVKPLDGNRSQGIETFDEYEAAVEAARARAEDLLVQEMIWPARCWRVICGRTCGIVDAYWRRPDSPEQNVLSITGGASIVRDPIPDEVARLAIGMTAAVDGDILGVDVLEAEDHAYALEVNHNFDAHGGTEVAADAFREEMLARIAGPRAASESQPVAV
jgi:glutathione synthase/RimK-type ligase-like ATP-grasp enzyme